MGWPKRLRVWFDDRREPRITPETDETAYLLSSPANAERLRGSLDEASVIGGERLSEIGKQAFQNLANNGLLGTALNTARLYEEDRAKLRRILPSDPAYDGVCTWMKLRFAKGYPLARATTIAVELAKAGLTPAQMTVEGAIQKVVDQHELLYGAYSANSRETIITTAQNWATRFVRKTVPILPIRPYDWDRDGL